MTNATSRIARLARLWFPGSTVIGLAIVAGLLCIAVFGPLLISVDPNAQNLAAVLQPPSTAHPLGTDHYGRDVLARLVTAARIDLLIVILALPIPVTVGSLLGIAAGYIEGPVDVVVSWCVNVVVAFPFYVLMIALVFVLGQGTWSIVVAVALVGWVPYARIMRAAVLHAKNEDWARAAGLSGYSHLRVIFRHILPNSMTQVIVYVATDIVFVLLATVSLGYLGIGVEAPTADWGSMVADGQQFIRSNPLISTLPGIAIVITGVGFALLGDGLARRSSQIR